MPAFTPWSEKEPHFLRKLRQKISRLRLFSARIRSALKEALLSDESTPKAPITNHANNERFKIGYLPKTDISSYFLDVMPCPQALCTRQQFTIVNWYLHTALYALPLTESQLLTLLAQFNLQFSTHSQISPTYLTIGVHDDYATILNLVSKLPEAHQCYLSLSERIISIPKEYPNCPAISFLPSWDLSYAQIDTTLYFLEEALCLFDPSKDLSWYQIKICAEPILRITPNNDSLQYVNQYITIDHKSMSMFITQDICLADKPDVLIAEAFSMLDPKKVTILKDKDEILDFIWKTLSWCNVREQKENIFQLIPAWKTFAELLQTDLLRSQNAQKLISQDRKDITIECSGKTYLAQPPFFSLGSKKLLSKRLRTWVLDIPYDAQNNPQLLEEHIIQWLQAKQLLESDLSTTINRSWPNLSLN